LNCQLAQPDPVLLLEHQKNALRVIAFAQLRAEMAENAAGEARRFIEITENQNFKWLKNLHLFDDFLRHVTVLFFKILSSSNQTMAFGKWI